MDFDKIISTLEKKPLSNNDILKFCKGKVRVLKYSELYNYDNIDDALKDNALILLYETQPDRGHWVCITKNGNNLEHFDSYGLMPDSELKWIKHNFRKKSKQDYKYLTKLMIESPYDLHFNQYKFQKLKRNINTCGRWCILRVMLKDLTLEQFRDIFLNSNYSRDFIATVLTFFA